MVKNHYFPALDILRGFAALSVVTYHVIELFGWSSFPSSGPLVWFRFGWMGVDLFFVISGFVISLSAFSSIDKCQGNQFRLGFLKRRFLRIVPLHYLTCLVFLVFIVPSTLFENFLPNLLAHIFFVHNIFPSLHGGINGANWSLGTEFQFYLLIALIAPWLKVAAWWKIALTFILSAWIWRFGAQQLLPIDTAEGPFRLFVYSTQLPGMLDEFGLGVLLAKLVTSEMYTKISNRTKWFQSWLIVFPLGMVGFVTFRIFLNFASYWEFPAMVIFFRSMLGAFFVLLIYSFCQIKGTRFLSFTKPFRYLGTISFGIYLWHLPVLLSLKELTWLSPQRALPLTLGLSIVFAIISWHFFEKQIVERYSRTLVFKFELAKLALIRSFKYKTPLLFCALVILATVYFATVRKTAVIGPANSVVIASSEKTFVLIGDAKDFILGGACHLDSMGDVILKSEKAIAVSANKNMKMQGWGVISVADSAVGDNIKLMLWLGDEPKYIADVDRVERTDVANYFSNTGIINSGFDSMVNFDGVLPGRYSLSVVMSSQKKFISCVSSISLIIS